MAKPSDLLGEVVSSVEAAPVSVLGDARRKREQANREQALSLKLAGMTYEQIGERLNISAEGAQDMVERTLERSQNRAVEQLRELENARLDRSQVAIWTQVISGDLKAIETFLRISQQRAKLNGLNMPTRIDLSISVRAEMEQALAQLERTVLGEVITVDADPDPTAATGQ